MAAKSAENPRNPRRIDYLPVAELVPDDANPKRHALDVIDSSVGRFGFMEPIVRDERTGRIISGHGRTATLKAMEARGDEPPEGIRLDAQTRSWLAPVVVGWASRSDSEAKAALVALNRGVEVGGWDDEALTAILDGLATQDEGLAGLGFTLDELDDLHAQLEEATEQAADAAADSPQGIEETPGINDWFDNPSGQRLIALSFDEADYAEVVAYFRRLRADYATEDNPTAVLALFRQRYPDGADA